ncbi:transposase [Telmatocola sphagniphila]|uniref:Transposase n=1 Tax=Telmatocola sphagniphila TaxID=1123043 RepID=A0A8E6BAW8_9BACT|nr:winged helix-turn-helix domain-containing protein [Telmatocola sphagniphila]QVL33783.1 transposase [Telmatocola sphagniphila]
MVMTTQHTPSLVKKIHDRNEQENRRRLGVQLVLEGHTIQKVAKMIKINSRSLDNWLAWHRARGEEGLKADKHPGPKSKMTQEQIQEVRSWLLRDAREFGFRTNLWTSRRIVQLIKEKFQIQYNANYFCRWLRKQGFSPQMPGKKAAQRNEQKIADWTQTEWPRISKQGGRIGRMSYSSMKPD